MQKSLGLVAPSAVDAWLTADGTLVRYRRDTSGIEVTVDYLRFGGKPPVAVPPAGETADRTAAVAAAVAKQRKGQKLGPAHSPGWSGPRPVLLLQKPKTAGRCRALARGRGGRRIR